MDVVFCTDNNYVMPCGITMTSLLENNKSEGVAIHIVGLSLLDDSKEALKGIADKYKSKIHFYEIDKTYLNKFDLSLTGAGHISIATYIRFFLLEILPPTLHKVLYLDCDLMIMDDLSDLWDTNLENYSMAGVIDRPTFEAETYKYLNYDNKYPYINAGVLLINLNYWVNNDTQNKLLRYTKENYDIIKRNDQDVMNSVLHESILLLPIRYNMHNFFFWRKCNAYQYQDEIKEALKKPAIIHFTTSMKPWLKGSVHPLRKEYLKYKKLSPWKDTPITWGNISFGRKMRYYKRVIFDKLGIKKHRYIKLNNI